MEFLKKGWRLRRQRTGTEIVEDILLAGFVDLIFVLTRVDLFGDEFASG